MDKIASADELQAELRKLLEYADGPNPSRQVLSRALTQLALRLKGDLKGDQDGWPQWLKDADTENAVVEIRAGKVVWKSGLWKSGTWENGTWQSGTWESGTWEDGTWKNGIWRDGIWQAGIWESGIWADGYWEHGLWVDGTWQGGTWVTGTWKDGTWKKGFWTSGTWTSGKWLGGEWANGTWWDGEWLNGTWLNGKWHDGTWQGGTWKRGVWEGGDWKDGEGPSTSRFNTRTVLAHSKTRVAGEQDLEKIALSVLSDAISNALYQIDFDKHLGSVEADEPSDKFSDGLEAGSGRLGYAFTVRYPTKAVTTFSFEVNLQPTELEDSVRMELHDDEGISSAQIQRALKVDASDMFKEAEPVFQDGPSDDIRAAIEGACERETQQSTEAYSHDGTEEMAEYPAVYLRWYPPQPTKQELKAQGSGFKYKVVLKVEWAVEPNGWAFDSELRRNPNGWHRI